MTLFWIGVAVFGAGVIIRWIFKFRMYHAYNNANGLPDVRRKEISARYRPLIFVGLGIEILGLLIETVYLFTT